MLQRFVFYVRQVRQFPRNARLYLWNSALSGVTTGIFLVLYNLYLTSLGYQPDFVGATLFAGTLGAGLAIFPAGWCIDRWSGKWILIWSSALIGLGGIGSILFRQPLPLLVCAFLTGVATAFTLVVTGPFLVHNSLPYERADLFSLNIVLTQLTTVLGEVIGGIIPTWLLHHMHWLTSLPAWVALALSAQPEARAYQLSLLAAGLLAGPSFLPLFLMSNDRSEHTSRRASGQREEQTTTVAPLWQERLSRARSLLTSANLRRLWFSAFFVLALVQTLTGLGAGLIIPYFNLFFVLHLHATPALFGLLDGTANGLMALTTLCAPWLARRIGRINSIVFTRLASLPLLLAIGLTGSLPVAAILYPLREGTMDMSQGVLQVVSMEAVSERHRGLANSTYQATYQIAWAITSSLGGLIIVHFGYSLLFIGACTCYLATILLLRGRFARTGKALP